VKSFRVIPLDFPTESLPIIQQLGFVIRLWDTSYRGPIAFVSQGYTWLICELVETKPYKTPHRFAYLWKIRDFKSVVVSVPGTQHGVWESPRGMEPPMLCAGSNAALNDLLFPVQKIEPEDEIEALYRALKEQNAANT
jgi:hypothetical protein